jgi:hypothetical protein
MRAAQIVPINDSSFFSRPVAAPATSTSSILKFDMDESLKRNIKQYSLNKLDLNSSAFSLEDVAAELKHLNTLDYNHHAENEKVILEKYKKCLFESVYQFMVTQEKSDKEIVLLAKTNISILRKYFNYSMFGLLFLGGLTLDGIGNFIFASSLFSLIPVLSAITSICLAIGVAVVNAAIFLAFDSKVLAEMFEIDLMLKDSKLFDIYAEQIKTAKMINRSLLQMQFLKNLSLNQHQALNDSINECNQDILGKLNSIKPYIENVGTKIGRYVITVFGLSTMIGGSYFFANTLLTMLSLSLIGTPAGWAITGACMFVSAAYYTSKGIRNLYLLFNQKEKQIEDIQKKLAEFVQDDYIDTAKLECIKNDNQLSISFKQFQDSLIRENVSLKNKLTQVSVVSEITQNRSNSLRLFVTRPRSKSDTKIHEAVAHEAFAAIASL